MLDLFLSSILATVEVGRIPERGVATGMGEGGNQSIRLGVDGAALCRVAGDASQKTRQAYRCRKYSDNAPKP